MAVNEGIGVTVGRMDASEVDVAEHATGIVQAQGQPMHVDHLTRLHDEIGRKFGRTVARITEENANLTQYGIVHVTPGVRARTDHGPRAGSSQTSALECRPSPDI